MDRFKALGVPAEVINLLKKPPLLEGESSEEYLTLVLGLFEKHHVSNTPEFLLLKRYADCWWEMERLERMRALIINHWIAKAPIALVKDHSPTVYRDFDQNLSRQYPHGVDPALLHARATVLASDQKQLAYFDAQIAQRQNDCEKILNLLGAWKATHRASEQNNDF